MNILPQPAWLAGRLRQPSGLPARIALGLLLTALCMACLRLGNDLADPYTNVVPVFPVAGFSVAVLLRFGWRRVWFWLALGVIVDAQVFWSLSLFWLIALGNIAAMVTSAVLVERLAGGPRFLDRPRNVFQFVCLGAGVFGLLSAAVGMGVLTRMGVVAWDQIARQGSTWAVADAVGVLLVAPPLLTWSEKRSFSSLPVARWAEMLGLLLIAAGVTQLSFGGWPFERHNFALEYLTIPVLLWTAFRFPRRGGVTATLLVAALAIFNTQHGRGTFAPHHHTSLVLLQVYLGSISMLVLVISAGVREQEAQSLALRQALSEAETARGAAERADRAKSAFLSRMSHELRTPLNAILGFGQILQAQGGPDEMVQECSTHILDAGRHLLSLVNEVLDIASLESGRLRLSLESVEAVYLIQECIDILAAQARERGVFLRVEGAPAGAAAGSFQETGIPARPACVVRADRQRLRQVISNLLSNAIQYNVDGGSVTVSFVKVGEERENSAPGERWRIQVTDTGRGISAEDQEQLFTPFQRLGAERTDNEGSGLGLVVSRSLVNAMGGQFGLESSPGLGSTFWLELPAAAPKLVVAAAPALAETAVSAEKGVPSEEAKQAAAPGEGDEARPAAAGSVPTLLYVEDNASNLQLVRTACHLYFPDLRLLSAGTGREGLRTARESQPGLILLDVQLPDIDGDVVLAQLRADAATREIPVVMLSADATPASRQRLLGAGAQDYLTKPLEMPVFLMLINRAFRANVKIPRISGKGWVVGRLEQIVAACGGWRPPGAIAAAAAQPPR